MRTKLVGAKHALEGATAGIALPYGDGVTASPYRLGLVYRTRKVTLHDSLFQQSLFVALGSIASLTKNLVVADMVLAALKLGNHMVLRQHHLVAILGDAI